MATVMFGGGVLKPGGLYEGWGIRIEGNRITRIAPNEALKAGVDDIAIDARDHIIAPGFINGHMHMYGVLSHGITAEALVTEFGSFLEDFWWPYVENRIDHPLARLTAEWACVEQIDSGITSFVDVLEAPLSLPGALNAEAEVVHRAGLRAWLTFEACERVSAENAQAGLKENAAFVQANNHPDSLVQGMMSVHTLFTGSLAFLTQAKALANSIGADIHMHLSESVLEPDWAKAHCGRTPVEVYDELGFLDERVLASQCVQVAPAELAVLKKRGVRAVHMPLSNCEVGGGIAPVPDMLTLGIPVGLGTDGYINNFFEVMRAAFLIHKAYRQSPQEMPAKSVYEMATSLGAATIGRKDTGRLEEGCLADLITIAMDTPTPINRHNVYDQLILFRNPQNVRDVMVNGVFLKRNGQFTTLNQARIKAQLRERAAAFWKGK